MKLKGIVLMLAFFAVIFGIVFLDQLTKWLAVILLKGEGSAYFINNFLRFTYVENRGAAFGMLSNQRWIFLVISSAMIIAIVWYMFKYRPESKLAWIGATFIVGGGIGNMIDRVLLGYVIDFIDFYTIWEFVFNVADMFVCVGAGIMVLYLVLSLSEEIAAEKKAKASSALNEEGNTEESVDTNEKGGGEKGE